MPSATFADAFPSELRSDMGQVSSTLNAFLPYDLGHFEVNVLNQVVRIPYRLFSPEVAPPLVGLSPRQRQMAQCILTRSSDGFERQAALRDVIEINTAWSIPFVIALIGEYVIEILDDIYLAMPRLQHQAVAQFIGETPAFYNLTRARVASYWNCYYRWYHPDQYVGFKLMRALDAIARPRT